MKRFPLLVLVLLVGALVGGLVVGGLRVGSFLRGPDPETIASASLQSVREQARLTVFAARFVAVITSRQERFGLSAQKTLIMPGLVRYNVDLARLRQRDLDWDEAASTLSVTLPPLEITGPEVDLRQIREYDDGRLLMALTDAERTLDQANRVAGQQELVRQAREAMPMRLARDAARRAVERSFALPLAAAGIDAEVKVRFGDEPSGDPSWLDRSRRMEDVVKEGAARERPLETRTR